MQRNETPVSRRDWLGRVAMAGAALALGARPLSAAPPAKTKVVVYKSPTCGCCRKWVEHMEKSGFAVETHDVPSVDPVKKQHGVPAALASCHTGLVGGYVLEGHVPADLAQRLLRERPKGVVGLAVPGMPTGSPGMEGFGKDRYEVLLFDRAGKTRVYARR